MSYLVLARKWRPQTFEEVVGQEHVTTTLRNAIRTGRIAHAYLFAGSRGVGKTTTARILAKALNCSQGPAEEPCNQCASCHEITGSRSLDVAEIDGASNRGIDEIRDLRENVKYTPTQGKYKVYIIDEVHMLTKEAFNALLKTLEEPPAHVIFIFATTEAGKVPMTILSRCQRFDFRRIEPDRIVAHLTKMLEGGPIRADQECLYLVSQKADGSLRDSISLLDQLISYGGDRITAQDVRQVLGLVDEALFFRAVELVRARDRAGILTLIDEVSAGGYDLQEYALGLLAHLRKLLFISAGAGEGPLAAAPAEGRQRYLDQAAGFDDRDLLRMIRILVEAESAMKRSSQGRLILEVACVRLCSLDSTVSIEELLRQLGGGEGPEGQPPKPRSQPRPQPEAPTRTAPSAPSEQIAAQAAQGSPPAGDFQDLWQKLLAGVKEVNMILGTCLESARPVGVSDGKLVLSFAGPQASFSIAKLEGKQDQALIEQQAERLWGQRLKVSCHLDRAAGAGPGGRERASRQDEVARRQQEAESSPQLKKFMQAIDGEIL